MPEFRTTTGDLLKSGCISLVAFGLGAGLLAEGTYKASQGQSPTADFMAGGFLILSNLFLWDKMRQAHENDQFYVDGVSSRDPRTSIPQLLERFGIENQLNNSHPNGSQNEINLT